MDHAANPVVRDQRQLYELEVRFDFTAFDRADNLGKKRITLETLRGGLEQVCRQLGWDTAPFRAAADGVVKDDYQNVWVWRRKASPDRRRRAIVECRHDVDEFACSLVLQDKNGSELRRQQLFTELPDEFVFKPRLGELAWESNDLVVLEAGSGAGSWRVKLD